MAAGPRTYTVSPAGESTALLHGAPSGDAGTGNRICALVRNESAGSATTATPAPGLVMNTVPSGRACMVTALGLARTWPSAGISSSVTSPVRAEHTCTWRPRTRRAMSPVGSVTTGSPPGHGAGTGADNLAFPLPRGNTLSRDSDAWARISAGSSGCGSLVVHSSRSELLAAAVDNAREGSSERWNGPVKAPLR